MGDLYLQPTPDGADIVIENGEPRLTGGLDNAVYLSLFTESWWGNQIAEPAERYDSRLPRLLRGTLTNQMRLDAIEAARSALAWMTDQRVADRIEVGARIASPTALEITVRVYQGANEFRYSHNWDALRGAVT